MPKPYILASLNFSMAFLLTLTGIMTPVIIYAKTKTASTVITTKAKNQPIQKKSAAKKNTTKKTTIQLYGVSYKVKAADAWKYSKKTAPTVRESLEAAEEAREAALIEANQAPS